MTGFNVNCSNCVYCCHVEELHHSSMITTFYFCGITGQKVNIEQNTDCAAYVKRRADVFEISH